MKKVAILVDGEWLRRQLQLALPQQLPHGVTAQVMYKNALAALEKDEELLRLFYYDCPPYQGAEVNPIDGSQVDFSKSPKTAARIRFLKEMGAMQFVALRLGVAKNRGWALTDGYAKKAMKGVLNPPVATDVYHSLEQKGVDMRLGIDVATLSLKKLVDRIVVISGDTDMIPAIKLARREGVQVVLTKVHHSLSTQLVEDADIVRNLQATP